MGILTWAGAISGAGAAAEESLLTMQKAGHTMDLEKSRQEAESLRQDKMIQANKDLETSRQTSTQTLQTERIGAEKELKYKELGQQKGLKGAELDEAKRHNMAAEGLKKSEINLEKYKAGKMITDENGRLIAVSADGKTATAVPDPFDPSKPLISAKSVNEADLKIIDSINIDKKDESREYEHEQIHTPESSALHQAYQLEKSKNIYDILKRPYPKGLEEAAKPQEVWSAAKVQAYAETNKLSPDETENELKMRGIRFARPERNWAIMGGGYKQRKR